MTKKIVTVVGATGKQGSGVVSALLANPNYSVRATTRRPNSDVANALRAKGAEVLPADVNDIESLKKAFAGSHVIYAVTDFFEPFAKSNAEQAMDVESQQGINLARAAAATPALEHYIWSTLPNSVRITGNKYLVPHFEGKNRVDEFIRSQPDLLAKTTLLWVSFYHSNFDFPMFTPYFIPTAGKYVQFASYSPQTPIETIGDVQANIGPFVSAILAQPDKTRNGAIVKAAIKEITAGDLLQAWATARGKQAAFVRTDVSTYDSLWPMWAEEVGVMMRFWDEYRDTSWSHSGQDVLTKEDLGIESKAFVPLEESLRKLEY